LDLHCQLVQGLLLELTQSLDEAHNTVYPAD
jgi:hypothetical protein